jgi:two-component system cell cycle sensor histidine kinase/response regulator CckA
VLAASDGEDALRVFAEHAGSIDLVLLDVIMPKLGGREVMDQIQARAPRMRFLFSSGYSEDAIHTNFIIKKGLRLISKPYRKETFLSAVREALDTGKDTLV